MIKMFFAKEVTEEEARQLGVDTWEPWVGETDKGIWHLEEQEVFYVTDGEVFITVDEKKHRLTKGWVASLAKDLVCEWDCPVLVKKNFILNQEIDLK